MAMSPSMDAELIMEFTDAEIVDALTANIAPPNAPPRHTQPPPQPLLQTGFATRPPPTAAIISEASSALRAVAVVSAWFDVPAGSLVVPPLYSSPRPRRIPTPPQPLFNTYCDLLQVKLALPWLLSLAPVTTSISCSRIVIVPRADSSMHSLTLPPHIIYLNLLFAEYTVERFCDAVGLLAHCFCDQNSFVLALTPLSS